MRCFNNPILILLTVVCSMFETSYSQGVNSEVAIIYNTNSTYGKEIAFYYADKYNIPQNPYVIPITCDTNEAVTKSYYFNVMRNQIMQAIVEREIKNKIKYLVTTKGMPLKIYTTANKCNALQYGGGAVESFLCLLFDTRIDTCFDAMTILNPYYDKDETFQSFHFQFNANCPSYISGVVSYLVSRLDAYTFADVKKMIDRGFNADTTGNVFYLLDSDRIHTYDRMSQARDSLYNLSLRNFVFYDSTATNITSIPGNPPLIGYCGHGAHAPNSPPIEPFMGWTPQNGYLDDAHFTWANGAIFTTYESFNGYSFYYKDNGCPYGSGNGQLLGHLSHQNLIADFIQDGGTCGIGNVYEPGTANIANESILFPRYAEGYRFIEAAYMSLPRLAFQGVVVGDPLCRINKMKNPAYKPPYNFDLFQNFPNPFNSGTTIEYSIPSTQLVTIKIYDELGREVQTLVNEIQQKGMYNVFFDARRLATGVYYYRILAGNFAQVKKMILLK